MSLFSRFCWSGLVAAALLSGHGPLAAQAPGDARAEAGRLRDAGDFAGAVALLTRHLAAHPNDSEAARLLAQTLYWLGNTGAATGAYQRALTRFPEDARLRLEFARVLAETGRGRAARETLRPLLDNGPGAAEAETLLGTIFYWGGDLAAAQRHFRNAVRLDPAPGEAERQLRDILTVTAPGARLSLGVRSDEQPLEQWTATAEATWHPTPAHRLAVRAMPQRYDADGREESVAAAEAEWRATWPRLRLETELAAGAVQRTFAPGPDWTGTAAVRLRLPAGLAAHAAVERSPYFWTLGSLDTAVLTETARATLEWDRSGWLGQAGYALQRFPDDNQVQTTFAWVLAPLAKRGPLRAGLGYGFNAQDAAASRFVPFTPTQQPGNRPPLTGETEGRYLPYYTPEQLQAHSVIGSVSAGTGAVTLSANGGYGVFATEQAPFAIATPGVGRGQPIQVGFAERRFHPWNARAAVNAALSRELTLVVEADHLRTAFYRSTTLGAGFTYRFTSWALRRLPAR